MNRRDLLKLIGIGGVGAVATVVGGKEAEAAPVAEAKPIAVPRVSDWSIDVDASAFYGPALMGSASYISLGSAVFDGRTLPLYMEMTPEQLRRFNDPFGGDE